MHGEDGEDGEDKEDGEDGEAVGMIKYVVGLQLRHSTQTSAATASFLSIINHGGF